MLVKRFGKLYRCDWRGFTTVAPTPKEARLVMIEAMKRMGVFK